MPKQNTALIPINPFALGGAFLEKSIKLGWVRKHRETGRTTYFLTPDGAVELEKFGIDTSKVRSYGVLKETELKEAEAKRTAHKTK
jgi:hypothetical protein